MMTAVFTALIAIAAAAATLPARTMEAASVEQYIKEATVQVGLVIAKSTASYQEALALARTASSTLHLPLKLRDLVPHKKTGLTYPKPDCEREVGDYPCYIARGRFDSGAYVSIEHSNAYPEFKPNLFIVILASGGKGQAMLRKTLERAQNRFPDTYLKTAAVYMGCMH